MSEQHTNYRNSDDFDTEGLVRRLSSVLQDHTGDTLAGVASYADAEYEVVYRDDDLSGEYSGEDIIDILENIQLETLSTSLYEGYHDQSLHATVRIYDRLTTIAVPAGESTGVVIALHNDEGQDLYALLSLIEEELSAH